MFMSKYNKHFKLFILLQLDRCKFQGHNSKKNSN